MRIESGRRLAGWAAGATLLALTGVYYLLPSGGREQAVLYGAIGFSAAAAVALGPTRRLPGSDRLPWLLLAAGVACFAAADSLFGYYEQTGETPFPSAADGLYLAAYPLLFAGVLLLGRTRGQELRFALADVFVAAGALALVQWVFVMEPLAKEESGVARVILLAYPAMDVLLAAALARLLFTPAWRAPALWLLAGAVLLQLVGDEIYLGVADTYTSGSWVDVFWLASYALFAATGAHPSARQLRHPAVVGPGLGWARVLLLGAALVAVPVALAAARPRGAELVILAGAAAALSVLVLLRIVDLVRLLAAENARLLEVDRLKDEFVGLVSHDLRTPLTSIAGFAELLLDDPDGDLGADRRRFLGVIDRNARRLQRLLDDLLFAASLQAGRQELDLREVDVAALARQCVEESRPTADEAGLALELDAPAPATVVADDARLSQLLDNLVSNALKFTPAGGRVEVSVVPGPTGVGVEVSDTGIGIPAGEEAHLFERFFRGSNARSGQVPGTGLGLHIAEAIVTAHGGSISVTSGAETGTTFRIELPLSPPAGGSGSRSP
jgi:signal transduction histidine kinase